jgi:hypothetical protein
VRAPLSLWSWATGKEKSLYAGLIITTEAMIAERPKREAAGPGGMPSGMGGMGDMDY